MPSLYLKRKNTIPFFIQVEKWRTFLLIFSRSREREWDQTRKDSPTFSHLYDFSLIGIVLCKWFTGNTINWQEKKNLISLQKRKMQQVVKKNLILTVLICFFFKLFNWINLSAPFSLFLRCNFREYLLLILLLFVFWIYDFTCTPTSIISFTSKKYSKKRRKNKTIWKIKGI